jgi:tetratricopeptide (TPR) repeat protein
VPQSAGPPPLGAEQLAKLLKETDVYVKYGLHDKALEHLGKIFAGDPENLDAHEKAYQVYVGSGDHAQAAEQLLNVLRLCTRLAAVDRAKPYLNTILQQNPDHPEVATFVSVLGPGDASAPPNEVEAIADDSILVDDIDEALIVPEAPTSDVDLSSEDIALQAPINADELVDEEVFIPFQDEEVGSSPGNGALPTVIVDSSELGTDASGAQYYELEDPGAEPDPQRRQAQSSDDEIPEYELQMDDSEEPEPSVEKPRPGIANARRQATGDQDDAGQSGPDSAAEECEEARFFLAQGLLDDAREILETVLIAYPGHSAARELLALVEEGQASPPPPPRSEETHSEGRKDAFDLAAELASELGQLEDGEVADAGPATEDFQYSVAEVFAEFKKGLEKVVRPEDVDTHYDLGIAYREMGLTEDAIGEFTVAREGCVGKKKEIDCLTMIAMLQKAKGDLPAAIESYKRALVSEHAIGETEKALEFELAVVWEGLGTPGKALYHYARVAKLDAQYRDVANIVARLSRTTKPEADPLPAKKAFGGPASAGAGGAKASYSKLQGS